MLTPHQLYRLVTLALALSLLFRVSSLAAAAPPAVDFENGEIAVVMDQEPQWLNSVRATDQVSFMVLDHISEGLLTYNENNELVARRWPGGRSGSARARFRFCLAARRRPIQRRRICLPDAQPGQR